MLYGIVAAALALALAVVLTVLLRAPALRLGAVDRRRQRAVPRSGGLAVALATGLVAGLGEWTGIAPLADGTGRLLAGAAGVALLGFAADVWRLGTRVLLGGTAVAAALTVPYEETGILGGLLGVGWIVFVALAFKGLDHVDGPAGAVGMLGAFGAGVCAASEVLDGLALLMSVLGAALVGFLLHNWPPARAGLGAGGALFTGFLLAGALVVTRAGLDLVPGVAVLFALTSVASADAVLVLLSRRLAGRPLLRRGPDHLAHRLRRLGLTPQGATALLSLGAGGGVLAGVLVQTGVAGGGRVLWVAGVAAVVVLALLRVPVYGARRRAPAASPPSAAPGPSSAAPRVPSYPPSPPAPPGRPRRTPAHPPSSAGTPPLPSRAPSSPAGAPSSPARVWVSPPGARIPPRAAAGASPPSAGAPVPQAGTPVSSQAGARLRVRNG